MAPDADDSGFLSRWSRRKALVRQGAPLQEPEAPALPSQALAPVAMPLATPKAQAVVIAPADEPVAHARPAAEAELLPQKPPPTLADAALLTRDSDYTRFVARGVQPEVKNAALAKLFTDPHFNVMDGLDTYIDDYGIPDPLPAGMLRQMAQSQFLGLFTEDKPDPDAVAAAAPTSTTLAQATPDEDAALRLQPHDAAGPPGAGEGAGPDPGRQC